MKPTLASPITYAGLRIYGGSNFLFCGVFLLAKAVSGFYLYAKAVSGFYLYEPAASSEAKNALVTKGSCRNADDVWNAVFFFKIAC